jgi:hypothetical protein
MSGDAEADDNCVAGASDAGEALRDWEAHPVTTTMTSAKDANDADRTVRTGLLDSFGEEQR